MELPATAMFNENRDHIKRCLHGTLRHEYRSNINKHVRLREDNRKQGRWRSVLNSVLGHLAGKKRQKSVDPNVMESWTGKIKEDPVEAHKELKGIFIQWVLGP